MIFLCQAADVLREHAQESSSFLNLWGNIARDAEHADRQRSADTATSIQNIVAAIRKFEQGEVQAWKDGRDALSRGSFAGASQALTNYTARAMDWSKAAYSDAFKVLVCCMQLQNIGEEHACMVLPTK